MSMTTLSPEDVKAELKRALIFGDTFKVEQILKQHGDVFTQTQKAEIMDVMNKMRFGVTDPEVYGKVMEIARKLSA